MRYLKLFLLSLVFFFLLLTGVGLLFPSEVHISRAVDLPGHRRAFLLQQMEAPAFRRCWNDSLSESFGIIQSKTDSSYQFLTDRHTSLHWVFHGSDGMITLQGRIDVQLGWLPWQRFQSLLLESQYGSWLEKQLEQYQRCLASAQVVSVSP